MASLHKHSSGRSGYWYASFLDADGKFKLRSTKQTDRSKAMTVALEYERAAKLARAGVLTESQCRKVLSDILEHSTGDTIQHSSTEKFLNDWAKSKRAFLATKATEDSDDDDSKATDRYTHTVKIFLEHLRDKSKRSINTVTARDITAFLADRLKSGKSTKTVSVDMKTLSSAFNRARKEGLISNNPVEAAESPKVKSNTRDVFTPAQVGMLVEAAPTEDWKTLILLGFFTGARLRDCAEMQWDNVKFERGVIEYEQRKTGKRVLVPMHPDLEAHLSKLASSDKPETYLCPSLAELYSGGKSGLSASFKRIMAQAGIGTNTVKGMGEREFSKLSFHSLRHTYNSLMANAEVPQEIRMKLTGHTTVSINANYTHHELAPLKAAISKIPSLNPPGEKPRGKK